MIIANPLSLSRFRLPGAVGRQVVPGLPSGRRVHQRDHPRDRHRVPQGQRRPGDGRRVAGHSRAPSNHGVADSQVASVKTSPSRASSRVCTDVGVCRNVPWGRLAIVLARETATATTRRDARRHGGCWARSIGPARSRPADGHSSQSEFGRRGRASVKGRGNGEVLARIRRSRGP